MNIRILDSWLREFLKTKATPSKIAEVLSLTSVSVERLEKYGNDYLYDIEVTTNRPDLMSIVGLARETATVLPEFGQQATFSSPQLKSVPHQTEERVELTIKNNDQLVQRVCAVVMEISLDESSEFIKNRLGATGIRSLNNVIDITNYVMREIGHPTHVMDYDRLVSKTLTIREARKGENIITLDNKTMTLPGGDIVAEDNGRIVDLLGIMGLENSVVTPKTKRILYFINTDDPHRVRKTSMSLSLRSEAATLNEKGIDPELAYDALLRGIKLFTKYANGKVLSKCIDIYPQRPKKKTIAIPFESIHNHIGVSIPVKASAHILKRLGFGVETNNNSLKATVPTWRANDINISEDLIEEIARVYGYHRLPSVLPPVVPSSLHHNVYDQFYWENKAKQALKYWGFTEIYTYSMVSADLFEGPLEEAVVIQNPLTEDHVYMRKTLVPSLLDVAKHNENRQEFKIFEIANVYHKKPNDLPDEILTLAAVLKKPNLSFYEVKGVVEQLLLEFGIRNFEFKKRSEGGLGADICIGSNRVGDIEILEDNLIDLELNFERLTENASARKTYHPISKFPPVIEDVSLIVDESIPYKKIVDAIRKQSSLVKKVELFDMYKNKKTFRIYYQLDDRNLTNEEVAIEREKIYGALEKDLKAKIT